MSKSHFTTGHVIAECSFDLVSSYRGCVVTSGGRVDTSGHFFPSFRTTKFFDDVASRSSLGRLLACQKSLFCEKRICVFIINGPSRWDFV